MKEDRLAEVLRHETASEVVDGKLSNWSNLHFASRKLVVIENCFD